MPDGAMFLGHLVIEKLLKAVYVKVHKKHAVHGHDLLRPKLSDYRFRFGLSFGLLVFFKDFQL